MAVTPWLAMLCSLLKSEHVFGWFHFCCNLPVCTHCRQQRLITSAKTFPRCLTSRSRTQKRGRCAMRTRTHGGSRRDPSAL